MRDFATDIITRAALSAGLPSAEAVILLTKKDNLTLDRPRIELQCLLEKYERSGRKLAIRRTETDKLERRELYTARLDVAANVLADDQAWLFAFCYAFVAALPRGASDARGNWIKVRVQKATPGRPPDLRVGDDVIEVFTKVNQLFVLSFTGRVTADELTPLIQTVTINPPTWEA